MSLNSCIYYMYLFIIIPVTGMDFGDTNQTNEEAMNERDGVKEKKRMGQILENLKHF